VGGTGGDILLLASPHPGWFYFWGCASRFFIVRRGIYTYSRSIRRDNDTSLKCRSNANFRVNSRGGLLSLPRGSGESARAEGCEVRYLSSVLYSYFAVVPISALFALPVSRTSTLLIFHSLHHDLPNIYVPALQTHPPPNHAPTSTEC
jgi:hypothetical protein